MRLTRIVVELADCERLNGRMRLHGRGRANRGRRDRRGRTGSIDDDYFIAAALNAFHGAETGIAIGHALNI